ncbi:hypothetical protein KMP13_15770 [Epibacterium ulvae]|uniref:hypothetical protein n=1 Tax=Epibacterium ulvae TaxID=1156985 RepID=UPI001BFC693A|nr:hypothetical protein [Epibacterium ulvae]MBT8155299.1 hypothetical protein [Epibacterium ulvae]
MTAAASSSSNPVIVIPAGEHGKIRLFQLEMRPEQLAFLRDEPGALPQIFGIDALDMTQVDLFDVADLEDLGLRGYLSEGGGIAAQDLAPDHDMLDSMTGPAMVLRSRAFAGHETRLTPSEQIKLVATYAEAAAEWSAMPVTSDSAKPQTPVSKTPPRQARAEARRLGFIFFIVVMSLFILILAALFL